MSEENKLSSVLIVPCAKCGNLNRAEIDFRVTSAKNVVEEEQRRKLQEEADHGNQQTAIGDEGDGVRSDDTTRKPVEGSTDYSASDKPDDTGSDKAGDGADSGNKGENKESGVGHKKPGKGDKK